MKSLCDGFYIYTNYNIIDGVKHQTIRAIFEYSNNEIILSCCGENNDFESPFILYQGTRFQISDTTIDKEMYDFLDSSCQNYALTGDIKDIKKELIKLNLDCGETFRQIYRPLLNNMIIQHTGDDLHNDIPSLNNYLDLPVNDQEYYNQLNQLEILIDDLYSVFKVIAPYPNNLKTFGHEIRNIIILACTEIDSMMKKILEKNNMTKKGKFFNTTDYVQLLDPLRLKDYALSFKRYKMLNEFSPFIDWTTDKPTQSLHWYDAYNQIKHDREVNFSLSSLENAIESVMAYAILLIAQYGYRNSLWNEKLGKVIDVHKEPLWNIRDFYIPKRDNDSTYREQTFFEAH